MSYIATIPVSFKSPRHAVYESLIDMGNFPMWVSGMVRISNTGRMTQGLRYSTENMIVGQISRSELLVSELIPDERIVLVSESGLISFRAVYELRDNATGGTDVVVVLKFAFENFVLNLARPAIESMAKARVQADLEMLNVILNTGGFTLVERDEHTLTLD